MANRVVTIEDLKKIDSITKRWGNKTRTKLAFQIKSLGLFDKGELARSIKVKLQKKAGEIESIEFRYKWYGLFHDVGAKNAFGKGVTLPAKNWKAKAINPNIKDLSDQLGDFYGDLAVKKIFSSKSK